MVTSWDEAACCGAAVPPNRDGVLWAPKRGGVAALPPKAGVLDAPNAGADDAPKKPGDEENVKAGVATAAPKGLAAAVELANKEGAFGALGAPNDGPLELAPNADGVAKPKPEDDAPKAGVEGCPNAKDMLFWLILFYLSKRNAAAFSAGVLADHN